MDAPVFFTDYDGVYNYFGSKTALRKHPDAPGYLTKATVGPSDRFHYDYYTAIHLRWSGEVVYKLKAARDAYGFKWVWNTTWNKRSLTDLDHFFDIKSDGYLDWDTDVVHPPNWHNMPRTARDDYYDTVRSARKYNALLDYLKVNPVPFVWVDDIATVMYDRSDFVLDLDVPHLVLATDPKYGMLKSDVDKVVDFFASLS